MLVVLGAACGGGGRAGRGEPACPDPFVIESRGRVEADALDQISGVEASAINPGVLWVHNDSAGGPHVYAMTTAGRHLGRFTPEGARNVDWEAIALGPGPDPAVSYLYIADVGDNDRVRESVVVYRMPEPTVDVDAAPARRQIDSVETFVLRYPNGPHDAEALLVDPISGDLVIVTKEDEDAGRAGVFGRAAPIAGGTLRAHEPLPLRRGTQVTGGDVASDGSAVVLRTYRTVVVLARAPGTPLETALQSEPCAVPSPGERAGEAIAVAPNGEGYVTISEGEHQPVNLITPR